MSLPSSVEASEAQLLSQLRDVVRHRPFVAVAAAGAVGAVLGGLVFSRAGKLVFLAIAGYAANELWRREGRIDLQDLIARLSNGPKEDRT